MVRDLLGVKPEEQEKGYKYRWLNANDRHLRSSVYDVGWQICQFPRTENPLTNLPGQIPDNSSSGVIRQRGDVVLARMPIDEYEEKVAGPIREARSRHSSTLDTMVASANERMHRESRNAGLAQHSKALVFREEDEQA